MAMIINSQEFGGSVSSSSSSFVPNMPRIKRISSTFYQVESFKLNNQFYDIIFNALESRWRCACYDARAKQASNKKYACKHIIALRSFIKEQEAMRPAPAPTTPAPAPAPAHDTRLDSLESTLYALDAQTNDRIDRQDRRIQDLENALNIKQDEIETLQDQRDRANGLINKLLIAQEAMQAKLDTLQQQVEGLRPVQITAESINISGPVKRGDTTGNEKKELSIVAIDEKHYSVDGYKVRIHSKGFAVECSCPKGQSGRPCDHTEELDKFLGVNNK